MDGTRTSETVLYKEVFLIQRVNNTVMNNRLNNTVKYYCGMRTGVRNRDVVFIQRVPYSEVSLYS